MSRLIALAGTSGQSGSIARRRSNDFRCNIPTQVESFEEINQSEVMKKHQFQNRDEVILQKFPAFLVYQVFNAGNKISTLNRKMKH